MGLMDRLDRLDQRVGVILPAQARLTQRELWREMLHPPVLWGLISAIGATVVAASFQVVLIIAVAPTLIAVLAAVAARRVRAAKGTDDSAPVGGPTNDL